MSDRKEDFSFGFSSDQYNVRPSTEDSFYNYSWSNDGGPKVLTTMRNMFAEEKSDDYELVYHNFSEEDHRKILSKMKRRQKSLKRRSSLNFSTSVNLNIPVSSPPPQNLQNFQRAALRNSQNFRQNHAPQNHQDFAPGPPDVDDDDDHEEEEDHDPDEEDYVEDFLQNRIVHHCPECSKKYTSERRLKHHIQVHKNADAYKCPKCGYCYQSPDSLRRHWKKTPNCDEIPVQRPIKTEQPVDPN